MIKAELVHLNKDRKFVKVASIVITNESGRFFDRIAIQLKINGKKISCLTLNYGEDGKKTMLLPVTVKTSKSDYEVYIEEIYNFNLLQSLLK